jgi:hypothetical protein
MNMNHVKKEKVPLKIRLRRRMVALSALKVVFSLDYG